MADTKYTDKMWQDEYDKWVNHMTPRDVIDPDYKYDENPRPLIQKLGLHITDRMFIKEIKADDPEYVGLAPWITDEMAEVALAMEMRKMYTAESLAAEMKRDTEEIREILEKLEYEGLCEIDFGNPKKEKMYYLVPFIVGSGEWMGLSPHHDVSKEAILLFDRMAFMPLNGTSKFIPPGGSGKGMHVIPVESAIENNAEAIDIEHISHWLKKYDGKYAVAPCVCRKSRMMLDETDGDDIEDMCIGLGDIAQYVVETDRGRYATYDEIISILKRAEEKGFVHQITNLDGPSKTIAICNCNVNTCNALRSSMFFNTPNMSRSAFVAHVDKEKCVACGKCVEICPAGATRLGQKLCTLNGEVTYPQHELPDDNEWPIEKWTPNYRYDNRTNCHDTGTSPCKTACPAHIAIQGYLKLAGEGKYAEALELIKKDNPFPAVCGRVCNRRCEDACTRGSIDDPVAIDAVKKYIADLDLDAKTRYIPKPNPRKMTPGTFKDKIAIIGAGPAGLSCAYYLVELGYAPTVFEKNPLPGGMMRYGIPEYKLERKVIDAEIDVLREMGVDIQCGVEVGKDITIGQLRKKGYKGFCLAIGAQAGARLGVEGEDLKGVFSGVEFLHEIAEGKKVKIGKNVIVIGGGNVAMDVARCAKRLGADKVTVAYRRTEKDMKASPLEIKEAREDGVEFIFEHKPVRIIGKDGKVTAFEFDKGEIPCDTVIAAIGQKVDLGAMKLGDAVINENGTVAAAELTYQTAQKDIFAVGDVQTGPRFVIDAIAAGREAAISLHRFVRPSASLTLGRNRRDFIELDKDNIAVSPAMIKGPKRQIEGTGTLTEEQVKNEVSRCLGCGATVVDPNRCIGCGLCTTKCMFDAIHLERDLPECGELVPREDGNKVMLPYMAKRAAKIAVKKITAKK